MASRKALQQLFLSKSAGIPRCATGQAVQHYSSAACLRTIAEHRPPRRIVSRCRSQTPLRWHSDAASASRSKVYEFEKIKSLASAPSPDHILIDVREPSEYEAGFIPTAVNIPISSQPDALFLSPEDFEDRFGFQKPTPEKELVFYCKAGVRSSAAAQLAQQQGYEKVAEYRGSWLDWQKKGGS
ncbi:MAG: hypothetical protein M1821_005372 [Bathelium mastoideum]|nr:MAG: hypothetical protein M1821_005372 [Bathelium mastoideum]KAI9688078.1 MAG: hypothetical protein M1822_001584 [Bathelium mastoideum]